MKFQLKQWHLYVIVPIVLLVLLFGIVLLIPEIEPPARQFLESVLSVIKWILGAAGAIILLVILVLGPGFFGYVSGITIKKVDRKVEVDKAFSATVLFVINLVIGLLVGLMWLKVAPAILTLPSGLNDILKGLGANLKYEILPLGWGIYAWIVSYLGFKLASE